MSGKVSLTAESESELRAAASAYWKTPSAATFARWQEAARKAIEAGEVGR